MRAIIELMLAGQTLDDVPPDDLRFVQDLGLVRLDPAGGLVVANTIYQEVLPLQVSLVTPVQTRVVDLLLVREAGSNTCVSYKRNILPRSS